MKANLLKIASVLAVAVLIFAPVVSFAQNDITPVDPPGTEGPITDPEEAIGFLDTILGWVARIFWIAAAFFIFVAAFKYLTAAGDPTKVKAASTMLLYAVVAIAVAILSWGIPAFVNNFLSS
jgi:hypothetical protein